jgi:hypothetical protein
MDERYEAFLKEVHSHKEWYEDDEYGEIIFNENAPKHIVNKYMKLKKLFDDVHSYQISMEEFEKELGELLR